MIDEPIDGEAYVEGYEDHLTPWSMPFTPLYDIAAPVDPILRPWPLPAFTATRGGLRFIRPPEPVGWPPVMLADFAPAIDRVTAGAALARYRVARARCAAREARWRLATAARVLRGGADALARYDDGDDW